MTKLCRYGLLGSEKPGLIDSSGTIRDLSGFWDDVTPEHLSPHSLAQLAKIDTATLPLVEGSPRFGVPVSHVSKCVCIGLNYADHAEEAGLPIPQEPIVFLKAPSALCGAYDDKPIPPHAAQMDWEVELGIIIGSTARYVTEADALNYVAGYCIINDVSERSFQMQSSQWDKGKGCDNFGPVGPYLVTADELAEPQQLHLWLDVNGTRRQDGSTATMIFSVRQIIAYLSRYMTLLPGDIIATGTPPGVGMGHKPPLWLQEGDEIRLGIEGLGEQKQTLIRWRQ
ncbi:fumarylacetoacetate hydrolase family protein [Bombella saccharophila]|uniref:Fumarylacetoacetate hydrolase family protein n=1 Tax=Bombella saccharophila TaxID=2967338 RepID=A0ABT3W5K6_9PROT|nr:fumarylacetoacetate hydrolase family protein [Bombella saccharophila]MCX5614337.1 fumarylacetoacetate hydrolase family protein [Bombella saccharophila]